MNGSLCCISTKLAYMVATALLFATAVEARPPKLPRQVSVPNVVLPPTVNIPPDRFGDAPLPEPRLEPNDTDGTVGKTALPERAPVPTENPQHPGEGRPQSQPADPRSVAPRSATLPAEEVACRARLHVLGVRFEERQAESSPSGCALPYPIAMQTLGKTIDITPEALMNCAMAEASARFAGEVISPAAEAAYGEALKSVSQASAYVCRPRNGTTKLSEHAFGNALDIAGFTLSKGTEINVGQASDEKAQKFLAAIREAACGPFKTVLGPGSDDDHAQHLHLDLAPREHGGTICQ